MEGPSVGAFDFTLRLAVWRTGTALGADGYGLILGAMEEQGQQLPPGGPSWDRMSWSLVVLSNQVPPRPLNPPPPPFSGLLHRRPSSRWWLRIQRRGRHPPPRKDGGSSRGTLLLRGSAPARAFSPTRQSSSLSAARRSLPSRVWALAPPTPPASGGAATAISAPPWSRRRRIRKKKRRAPSRRPRGRLQPPRRLLGRYRHIPACGREAAAPSTAVRGAPASRRRARSAAPRLGTGAAEPLRRRRCAVGRRPAPVQVRGAHARVRLGASQGQSLDAVSARISARGACRRIRQLRCHPSVRGRYRERDARVDVLAAGRRPRGGGASGSVAAAAASHAAAAHVATAGIPGVIACGAAGCSGGGLATTTNRRGGGAATGTLAASTTVAGAALLLIMRLTATPPASPTTVGRGLFFFPFLFEGG